MPHSHTVYVNCRIINHVRNRKRHLQLPHGRRQGTPGDGSDHGHRAQCVLVADLSGDPQGSVDDQ